MTEKDEYDKFKDEWLAEHTVIHTCCDCVIYVVIKHNSLHPSGYTKSVGYMKICDTHLNEAIDRFTDEVKKKVHENDG